MRYRRASFGVLWAVGLPLFLAAIQTVVFSHLMRIQAGTAYVAYIYTGLVSWTFFSGVFGSAATAIVDSSALASRIYFPRMDLVIVKVVAGLYTFWVSLVILIGICVIFGVHIGPQLLLLIPATLLMTAVTLSFSLLSSGAAGLFPRYPLLRPGGAVGVVLRDAGLLPTRNPACPRPLAGGGEPAHRGGGNFQGGNGWRGHRLGLDRSDFLRLGGGPDDRLPGSLLPA